MRTISEFTAYGLISSLSCKQFKGCPCCGPKTDACVAKTEDPRADHTAWGSKTMYDGLRRYLSYYHSHQRYTLFNGEHDI